MKTIADTTTREEALGESLRDKRQATVVGSNEGDTVPLSSEASDTHVGDSTQINFYRELSASVLSPAWHLIMS